MRVYARGGDRERIAEKAEEMADERRGCSKHGMPCMAFLVISSGASGGVVVSKSSKTAIETSEDKRKWKKMRRGKCM